MKLKLDREQIRVEQTDWKQYILISWLCIYVYCYASFIHIFIFIFYIFMK